MKRIEMIGMELQPFHTRRNVCRLIESLGTAAIDCNNARENDQKDRGGKRITINLVADEVA